ncbi:hypothetical protein HZS_2817 [Henneguya salminicola]|nr:hypothetical protein HZS_2817 [Henneguya salminicola]
MHSYIKRKPERSRAQLLVFHNIIILSADRSKKFWRWELKNQCRARLHTTVNNLVQMQMNQHSHGRDAAQINVSMLSSTVLYDKHRLPFMRRCQIKTQFARIFSGEETNTKQHLHKIE